MKHLKKFENTSENNEEFDEIKSILTELKDEYPYIEGQIFFPEIETDPTITSQIEIQLECENVFSKDLKKGTVEYHNTKLKFIELVIKTIERLELSLDKTTFTQNLWNWDHWQDTTIKIFIFNK